MRQIPIYESLMFNGKNSLDFAVRISSGNSYDKPERDITEVTVAGRNGTLTIDNKRFKNQTITYPCFIVEDIESRLNELADFLNQDASYHRLEDTYHPEYYRMAKFVSEITPDTFFNESGTFDLSFNCMPQKWLKSGENAVQIKSTTKLRNPTHQIALPLIKVKGTGTFTINDKRVNVKANAGALVIDSELQISYEGQTNRSMDIEFLGGEYPQLVSGYNSISVEGLTLELVPRWWIL